MTYREDDLAFLFIIKRDEMMAKLGNLLERYHKSSGHVCKSMHCVCSKAPQPTAESGAAEL
jgi:hypothetical protein